MKCSEAGRQLIKKYEGFEHKAYLCPANVLTIGYGHTGPDVKEGMTITEEQADLLLDQDLGKFSQQVEQALDGAEVNQNQFDALCSLAYNIGIGAFKSSTLLKLIKQGKVDEAAEEFPRWNKAGGRELKGLTLRRQEERRLFLTEMD